jgi:uncharacterized protein (TIGR02145 family)
MCTFKDLCGKEYKTVKIGSQVWMAENLVYAAEDSKCYGEDSEVGIHEGITLIKTFPLSNVEIQVNCQKYGRLYNWETAIEVCPKGWHLPSNDEWNNLCDYVCNNTSTRIPKVGKYLKAKKDWSNWYNYKRKEKSGNGEDKFGFAALPGGCYDKSRDRFEFVSKYGYWWSATEDYKEAEFCYVGGRKNILIPARATCAYYFYISYNNDVISYSSVCKTHLRSVRYVKD